MRRKVRGGPAVLAVALIAAIAAIAGSFRSDLRQQIGRISSGSDVVTTSCGLIEYASAGSGPPVLVIHGAGGGFDQGIEFARPLLEEGFRVIAPSRFGYLRTPMPADASPEAQADAHACLLDALHVKRVAALGVSAGAPSTMQLCLRHPERCSSMTLVVPLAFSEPGPMPAASVAPPVPAIIRTTLQSDLAFWLATHLARTTMIETILATPIADFDGASLAERQRAISLLEHIQPVSRRALGLRNDAAIGSSLPRYELERIHTPTFLVTARNDLYGTSAGSSYTALHLPGARLLTHPDGGHVLLGRQKESWAAIRQFLAGQGSRASLPGAKRIR